MEADQAAPRQHIPWNKGKLFGQKAPFKPKDVWAIHARMERERRTRELALFNLGIDSKLRGCDLVALKVRDIGLDWTAYGTHSIRRTKAALIYQKTKNLRAGQLLLGYSKLESTVRYLGVDVHDALEISEQTEI